MELVYFHIYLWNLSSYRLAAQPLSPQDTAAYWTAVIQVALGFGLIAFAVGLSRLFNWLRHLRPDMAEKL